MYHSEYHQDQFLDEEIFKGKRNGVFVEIGALDGVLHSNSLFFEEERDWDGLLVEANPLCAWSLEQMRPLATKIISACYCRFGSISFCSVQGGLLGWSGIRSEFEPKHKDRIDRTILARDLWFSVVGCMPLDAMLRAAKLHHVDYLSLDVEGAEPAILRVFPFTEFEVDVFGVENNFGRTEIADIMGAAGYEKFARIGVDDFYRRPK